MKIYIIQQHIPHSDGLDYFKIFLDKKVAYREYQKLVKSCEDQINKELYLEIFQDIIDDENQSFDSPEFVKYFSDLIEFPHYDGIIQLKSENAFDSGYLSFIETDSESSKWFRSQK
jgi:hypothetical protein